MKQLKFQLTPREPFSLRYFVAHSGTAEAVSVLEQSVADVAEHSGQFHCVFVYGPAGSGKTHLLNGFYFRAIEGGIEKSRLSIFSLSDVLGGDDKISEFVSRYEELKRSGGLLFVEGPELNNPEINPHVRSRLFSGYVVRICYPQEEELRPLLMSLVERKNLRLSEYSINYLLRWLPLSPLAFDKILSAVDEILSPGTRRGGHAAVTEVIKRANIIGKHLR